MSQLNALCEGYIKLKQKESDAIKRSASGTRRDVGVGDLSRVPGVKIQKRKK